jgi:hypothetical protein
MNILPFTARVTKSSPQISADERQFELRLDIALSRDQPLICVISGEIWFLSKIVRKAICEKATLGNN